MSGPQLRVVVEADGGARGNPGPAGYGALVRDLGTGQVLAERSAPLGVTTNNVAEYSGLIAGLEAAAELGAIEVEVRMDSKLVIEQMSGRWKIKHPGLRPLAARAAALVRQFSTVRFGWVPRERNRAADALANAAMDSALDGGSPPDDRRTGDSQAKNGTLTGGASTGGASTGGASTGNASTGGTPQPGSAWPPASERSTSWHPPATSTALRLILVRHGETTLTAQRRYSGRGDVPLSDRGRAQAQALARRVVDLGGAVSVVLSSPLGRCRSTAEAIADAAGAKLAVERDLTECDFGVWEGLTFAEVRERYPVELAAWLRSPAVAPPGGESFHAVSARVRRLVASLREEYPDGLVVVVSHVSPIKLILRDALAAGDAFLHRCYLSPAGLSIVDSYADGSVAVRSVNETAHLSTIG